MLRYVKVLQQNVIEFCCSRAIFSNVNIPIEIHDLFDNEYIYNTFNKFKRNSETDITHIKAVCNKCDGYGFYDWVYRISQENEEDFKYKSLSEGPLIVKNENPISVIYELKVYNYRKYFYPSKYDPTNLTYRCEKCFGTGLALLNNTIINPLTIENLPEKLFEPEPIKKQSLLKKLLNYIKRRI